ncbi:ribulose-bisphosphate carboxylase [Candidatus Woesearchaeota archaeon]|uniref:RuBisCO long chain, Form II/III n=1 Tax=uncultured Candidatus Woesearchaeota archaeon TaxID=2014372 RepID=A0A447IUQ5_9ARCH|nr:ribulose-bisphosphate carboxylase [Candidatus Woesearchaeota archaeon]VDS11195.1 RuBisCO long chain, Form II/III [uncultured Candidatus Woesearchaeota archaeon]VDS11204.1 RuBisCO long chain, Form II/III [uncultured Candidatus Woesearchaeota archaeon]VDS11210.1 RuBisCO long chain, Form II/III [uncultured Candidatus Woesearchaeota archaeon]
MNPAAKLLKSLNSKQRAYVNLDLKAPKNGEYMLVVFHLIPGEKLNILQAASEVAAESSTGTNFKVSTETAFSRELNALVYNVDLKRNLIWVAYPWRIFDRGGNVQNILTFVVGNVLGMKEISALKMLDVWFPTEMLEHYDGPSYTLDDMRKYLGVYGRPILGTIIKPKIGLTAAEYAEVCYDFWSGGGDFVKNDEPQANQDFCDYEKMVKFVKKAMDKAVKETGHKKVHSFNVSASDFDEMIRRCELIRKTGFEKGSYAYLIDGITAGWMAVQTLRRKYPNVFLHFHRAAHGAFTRPENPIGFSVLVLSKFAKLAGASGIHTGTAGVGKMKGSPDEDITAAKNILHLISKGHFFEQSWAQVPQNDEQVLKIAKEDYANHVILNDDSWRGMKKCCPIISGGLNPTKLKSFIDIMGEVDFITTMGAGVHAHPRGTYYGAKALIQACEAYNKGINIRAYAKSHKELAEAINFFENRKETKALSNERS